MPADRRPLAIALMGPTASGKTALALEAAQRWNGEIVSVDSALVYRGLDIGAAKPDAAMRAAVPHHLLDLRDPWQIYSAAEFAADAREAIDDIVARGKLPILAGGTGLYFRAVLEGLSQLPEADPTVRAAIAAEAEQVGWAGLHAQLRRIDPIAAARIHATDPQRIQRALEVYRLSGRPISHWQALPPGPRLPLRVLKIVLAPQDRAVLHARIAQRLDAMLAQDFLAEVTRLRELPQMRTVAAPLDLPAVRAVGYRQAWEYLDGAGSLAEFRDKAIQATRQLAKRQLTWLRGELDTRWFDPERDRHLVEEAFVGFLAHRTAVQQASGV
ncbi:tRNA (adenosine(37)-N6)-dimethylallyltransferase MiaA [Xanthomonas vesicatoria ATCC 35937]|uniref:tRNA dimethylallyltransferase n=1 Tax=Xanthomonas vesicatoria ATCC 35937 TaxID=925775 RepID=F0BDP6_9XANT|nr:tRNA (adenosine(37)-N6)-dimethylallyltransferase MiaA [Xanthomonas vesicatoria]APP77469.1 tRNA (adenosine(37)-N6)-dimethylallyltransferase MiaA [Xanthomonas vesicatoria ATCC 35937]EGD09421.1 tRNA isopentenyltransferase MiaA [Xanthomonas vesicatoria ATCC 35937]KTF33706.1 tRNA dimethylallyltransferase [Xanthomonas vesicatoria]MCC8595704.1 tRNA (adenosine(37)-N6)-dimethylallyltransferase MiaA [Xanthomonas vesicatoria]MCC8604442.1 tRNA (adenosine(37)-N6)-dimethylallyltransferase MiaA [Xanthomon